MSYPPQQGPPQYGGGYPQQPYYAAPGPGQWAPAPPPRSDNTLWIVLAAVLAVVLVTGIGFVVFRSVNQSRDLDPVQRAFPELVPRKKNSGTGFQDTDCTSGSALTPPPTMQGGPSIPQSFDSWVYAWGCVNTGGRPSFTILQFPKAADAACPLSSLPRPSKTDGSKDGVSYTNYSVYVENGRPYMFTAFPNDSERSVFLLYTYGTDFNDQLVSWVKHNAPLS